MTASPAVLRWTLSLAVLVLGIAGFVGGLRVGGAVSEPDVEELRFVDPAALEGIPDSAVRSRGGFTGFEGVPALTGNVLRAGHLAEIEAGVLRVNEPSASVEVAYEDGTRLFRIAPADPPLAPGDRVLVRTEGDQVTGVLRIVE